MYSSNSASCLHCSTYQPFIIYCDYEQLQCVHFQVRSDVNVHFTWCLSKHKRKPKNIYMHACTQKKCTNMHAQRPQDCTDVTANFKMHRLQLIELSPLLYYICIQCSTKNGTTPPTSWKKSNYQSFRHIMLLLFADPMLEQLQLSNGIWVWIKQWWVVYSDPQQLAGNSINSAEVVEMMWWFQIGICHPASRNAFLAIRSNSCDNRTYEWANNVKLCK